MQNNQKPMVKAVSIRDEIRNIVREELKLASNPKPVANNAPKQEKYSTLKVSSLSNLQSQVQSKLTELKSKNPSLANQQIRIMLEIAPNNAVQQAKPAQKPVQTQKPQVNVIQNKPQQQKPVQAKPQQGNVVRITSVQQLAQHLQNAINAQLAQRKEMVKVMASQQPLVKVAPSKQPSKPAVQQKPQPSRVPVKIVPNAISNKPQQKQPVQPVRNSIVSTKQNEPGAKFLPGNPRGQSKNNPVLQQQANDLLAKIALAKKQAQNNQQKK